MTDKLLVDPRALTLVSQLADLLFVPNQPLMVTEDKAPPAADSSVVQEDLNETDKMRSIARERAEFHVQQKEQLTALADAHRLAALHWRRLANTVSDHEEVG
jgi:hypothetical protein